ncbi:MAG: hypothetical protein ACPG5R_07620 [Cognaticolwellia aestuarii]
MDAFYEQEEITPEELRAKIFESLKNYDDKSFLEMFSLYLGKVQLLEFALKKLLVDLYGIELDTLERKTLGQTRKLLENNGLRTDYLTLLNSVVDDRNHAAHEMLANQALLSSFEVEFSERFQQSELLSAVFKLEQSIILFDYFQRNNAW